MFTKPKQKVISEALTWLVRLKNSNSFVLGGMYFVFSRPKHAQWLQKMSILNETETLNFRSFQCSTSLLCSIRNQHNFIKGPECNSNTRR